METKKAEILPLRKKMLMRRFRRVIWAKQDELNACRRAFNEAHSREWKSKAVHALLAATGYERIITTNLERVKRYFQEHRA